MALGEAHAPGHTKLQPPWMPGLWEPAQSCPLFLLVSPVTRIWARWVQRGCSEGRAWGHAGLTLGLQGAPCACPPWPTTGNEVSSSVSPLALPFTPLQVWDRCSGEGVVTSFQVLRVSWAQP